MSKILILGAAGNICALVASMLNADHPEIQLRLTSSRAEGVEQLRAKYPNSEVARADWYDPESLSAAMQGIDKVLVVTPDFYTDESVVTPNIIRAVKLAKTVKHVVRFIALPPDLGIESLSPEVLATRCGANLHIVAKPLFDASNLPMTYINAACWIMFNLPWFMAGEVVANDRVAMPKASDAPRLWIAEGDIAAVATKILADEPSEHIGKEYLITGQERFDFEAVAGLISEVVGRPIRYVDDDKYLRSIMGKNFDVLMTYFTHETQDYRNVPSIDTVRQLLGREQISLKSYIEANKNLLR